MVGKHMGTRKSEGPLTRLSKDAILYRRRFERPFGSLNRHLKNVVWCELR